MKCKRYYNFSVLHFYGVCNSNGSLNEDLVLYRHFRTSPTFSTNATYSKNVTVSTLALKGSNEGGYYLYVRTPTSGTYELDLTIKADAEIY